jgi:hypothetical protein
MARQEATGALVWPQLGQRPKNGKGQAYVLDIFNGIFFPPSRQETPKKRDKKTGGNRRWIKLPGAIFLITFF